MFTAQGGESGCLPNVFFHPRFNVRLDLNISSPITIRILSLCLNSMNQSLSLSPSLSLIL